MNLVIMTLVFIVKDNNVLLGLKTKKALGEGLWNGFGGHVEPGEDIDGCAKREVKEESGLKISDLQKLGILTYVNNTRKNEVHIYRAIKYSGIPKVTNEMQPKWFHVNQVLDGEIKIWPDMLLWFDNIILNRPFQGTVYYNQNNTKVLIYAL